MDAVRVGRLGDFEINKVIYLRRTEADIKKACESNPFKRLNADKGCEIKTDYSRTSGMGRIWEGEGDNRKELGYTMALSTFAGVRGVDFSDVNLIIFDEFIPEKTARPIKAEGDAFLHMIETVSRNREVLGELPVRVILLANSITLNSPILYALNLVQVVADMVRREQWKYTNAERGVYIEIVNPAGVGIVTAKKDTALYRLTEGTDFERQALLNQFTSDDLHLVRRVNLSEYKPIMQFGGATIYAHKANNMLYAAMKKDTAPLQFAEYEHEKFRVLFAPRYRLAIAAGVLFFDSINTKLYLDSALVSN